ncbi:TetR/AcrR family transcriptional regulator [Amycolatopsis sp. lyj-112]|uniref:TetR/AcrR family transcriptional regulator n=1 Tax=Amycolatopsis sp. lyj-112 TaxID=2789288 RepID=UPI003978DDBD
MNRSRGRPRDDTADERILDAALEALLSKGYDGFSMDAVAAQAGCAKTTLYRRWPSQDHLIVAVVARMQQDVDVADTGDIRRDLVRYLTAIAAGLNRMRRAGRPETAGGSSAGVIAEITAAAARHEDIGLAVQRMFEHRNKVPLELIERAKARGDLPADLDAEVLFDQLAGGLYYRVLVTQRPVGPSYVDRLVKTALAKKGTEE